MEYQTILNLLENTLNQPTEFRTRHGDEINDESRETYNTNNQIKCKTSNLKLQRCICTCKWNSNNYWSRR